MKSYPSEAEITLTAPQTPADLEAAATVLAADFQDAPNFVAAFPDGGLRRALRHIFRMLFRNAAVLAGVTLAMLVCSAATRKAGVKNTYIRRGCFAQRAASPGT